MKLNFNVVQTNRIGICHYGRSCMIHVYSSLQFYFFHGLIIIIQLLLDLSLCVNQVHDLNMCAHLIYLFIYIKPRKSCCVHIR